LNFLFSLIRNFFGFSRSETNGFIILLPLLAFFIFSEPVYRYWINQQPDEPFDQTFLDSLVVTLKAPIAVTAGSHHESGDLILHAFDPNTATAAELTANGIPEKVAHRILNYRSKGGRFRVKKDFAKIYGVDSVLYFRLQSSILLPAQLADPKVEPATIPKPVPRPVFFDINRADSLQLISIRGIGPKKSSTFIKYREKLGGFVSLNQLYEIYGFDSAVVNELRSKSFIDSTFTPHLININECDEKQLASMPYIHFRLAKIIITYRRQHGNFTSVEDLKKISLIDESTFNKAKPYLTVNP
jgi:competence ComEA-like helix-hairpin-helix protein